MKRLTVSRWRKECRILNIKVMKTKTIFKSFAALFAAVAFFAVSCDEPESITPVFPELVEDYGVALGDTLHLTFTPNMDWDVTVPEDTMDVFWINNDGFADSRISGQASAEPVTVQICVSDKEDFVNRTTTVKLTMGGETRIVARYMCPAASKSIQVYVCKLDEEGAMVFDDQGDYVYVEATEDDMKLVWTGADFRRNVKVVSNFDWSLTLPEWALADIPEVRVGSHTFNIQGVPSKYPLQDTSADMFFSSEGEDLARFPLQIPGCSNILSFGIDMVTSLNFNDKGRYLTSMRFLEGPAHAWIEGVAEAGVYAFEFRNGKYNTTGAPSWLKVSIDKYDSSTGVDVLQRRDIQVSVDAYQGRERSAVLLFMPPLGSKSYASMFTEDATSVKEEWQANAVYVNQKEYGFLVVADEASFNQNGGSVLELDPKKLPAKFASARYAYQVDYTNSAASDYGRVLFSDTFDSYKIFDAEQTIVDRDDYFLGFRADSTEDNGAEGSVAVDAATIEMYGMVDSEGYIVLYNGSEILAVIHCIYTAPKNDDMKIYLYGESVDVASVNGITLEELTADETDPVKKEIYDQYKETEMSVVYHLQLPVENVPLMLQLPNTIKTWNANPWKYLNCIRLNGKTYLENSSVKLDGNSCLEMNILRPDDISDDYLRMNINLMTAESSSIPSIILVCTLDLRK